MDDALFHYAQKNWQYDAIYVAGQNKTSMHGVSIHQNVTFF